MIETDYFLEGLTVNYFNILIKVLGSYSKKMSYVLAHSSLRRSCEENASLYYVFKEYANFSFLVRLHVKHLEIVILLMTSADFIISVFPCVVLLN